MDRLVATALAATAVLVGCYGSTEPATNIGEDSATLNGRGTANNGPARSWFEYTDPSGFIDRTPLRHWPAGASGPFSERVTNLFVAAQYSFRLCGEDEGIFQTVCAQTRTFRTPPFAGDYVQGHFTTLGPLQDRRFRARSGPGGENAKGEVRFFAGSGFEAFSPVTCLKVSNNRAIIGTVEADLTFPRLWAVQDGPDGFGSREAPTNPPNCSSLTFDQIGQAPTDRNDVVVHDEP
jgi:hypothetical protein